MSYSFSARGATREALMTAVAAELDKVVEAQPIHKADREQAYNAVEWFAHIVPETDGKDLSASVSGSVSSTEDAITAASVNVSVSLVDKAA